LGTTKHTVQSGDTLWDLAADHHLSFGELLAANPQIRNPDLIQPGQIIVLPEHRAPGRVHAPAAGPAVMGGGHGTGHGSGGGLARRKTPTARLASGLPSWFHIAADEEKHFVQGRQVLYHRQSGVGCYGQDWCSVFVNWVMQRVGYTGTRNAMAQSWMQWGIPLQTARRGAIVVFDDGFLHDPAYPNNPYFHVGFVDNCSGDMVRCLGGNQSCAVTYASFHRQHGPVHKGRPQRFHFRWPPH